MSSLRRVQHHDPEIHTKYEPRQAQQFINEALPIRDTRHNNSTSYFSSLQGAKSRAHHSNEISLSSVRTSEVVRCIDNVNFVGTAREIKVATAAAASQCSMPK